MLCDALQMELSCIWFDGLLNDALDGYVAISDVYWWYAAGLMWLGDSP